MQNGTLDASPSSAPETDPLERSVLEPGEEVFEGIFEHGSEPAPGSAPTPPSPAPDPAPAPAAAPGDPAAPAAGEPAATPADATPAAPQAYTVRADGADYEIRGATLTADGALVIPKDSLPWVERVLQQGISHQGSFHKRIESAKAVGMREGMERAAKEHPSVIEAQTVLEEFEALIAGGPDAVLQWAENFERNKGALELKRAQALYAAKEARDAAASPAAAPQRLEPAQAHAHLSTVIATLAQQEPTLAILGDHRIAAGIAEELAANPREYFYVADEDDPANDVVAGEIVCDVERVVTVLQHRARLLAHVTQQAGKVEAAKASNAEKLQAAGVATPAPAPVVPPAVTGGAAPGTVRKLPTTPAELEEFEDLPLDEQNRIIAANARRSR